MIDSFYAKYGKKKTDESGRCHRLRRYEICLHRSGSNSWQGEDTEAFLKAMHTPSEGSVSSAVSVDANGNAVRDFLISAQVQKKDGLSKNVVLTGSLMVHQPLRGIPVMPGKYTLFERKGQAAFLSLGH